MARLLPNGRPAGTMSQSRLALAKNIRENAFANNRVSKTREIVAKTTEDIEPNNLRAMSALNSGAIADEGWNTLKDMVKNPKETLKGALKLSTLAAPGGLGTLAAFVGPKEAAKTAFGMPSDKGSQNLMLVGGTISGPEGQGVKGLNKALQEVNEEELAKYGYRVITPKLEELTNIIFGSREINKRLPVMKNIMSRANIPTIIKQGQVLEAGAKGTAIDVAGKVNRTVEDGYARMLDEIQAEVKRNTGQYLTRHQIEQLTGLSLDQAVTFGEKIGNKGFSLTDEAAQEADKIQKVFQETWPGAHTGSRILGLEANKDFLSGAYDLLTGNRFKNIGGQDDHIKSPTTAGIFIGREVLSPMLQKGKTTLEESKQALVQEINRRTQNVNQIVRTPQPTNLGIGSIDFPLLENVDYVTKRLGKDITGLLDLESPTYSSYLDKSKNIWDSAGVEDYLSWHNSEKALEEQIKRLKKRVRGKF